MRQWVCQRRKYQTLDYPGHHSDYHGTGGKLVWQIYQLEACVKLEFLK